MKETKRRVELFSFYDHTGIEAHLAHMAAKGWLLDKIGNFTWHYRRVEPQTLTFSVSYFPEASQYDPGPSGKQEMFYDLCAHTGWTLAASSAQMQVFYNERENPVPIDTDPALEVDAIHRSAKKGYFISQALLAGVGLLNLVQVLFRLHDDPIQTLASPTSLFLAVCWPALLVIIGVDTGSYFLWRHKALRAAEQGEFLPTKSHTMVQRVLLAVVLIAFVWSVSTLSSGLALITVATVAALLAVILLITGIRDALRSRQTPAGTNKAVTITLCIVLPILLTAAIPFLVIRSAGSRPDILPDELPLALADLPDLPGDGEFSQIKMVNQSPLLAVTEVYQNVRPDGGRAPSSHWLDYQVAEVRFPALYGLCKTHLLADEDDRDDPRVPEGYKNCYAPIDPAPWGADEAYRFSMDGEWSNRYLLLYPGRIVELSPSWELTPAQMAVVGEKLRGV